MDTNGSTESFELVTEDNNGEGKAKTDGRNSFYVHNLKSEKEVRVCVCVIPVFCPSALFQLRHPKTSGFLWSCALACRSSAPSSTAKCAEKSPRTNSAAAKGEVKKEKKKQEKWLWAASGSV